MGKMAKKNKDIILVLNESSVCFFIRVWGVCILLYIPSSYMKEAHWIEWIFSFWDILWTLCHTCCHHHMITQYGDEQHRPHHTHTHWRWRVQLVRSPHNQSIILFLSVSCSLLWLYIFKQTVFYNNIMNLSTYQASL